MEVSAEFSAIVQGATDGKTSFLDYIELKQDNPAGFSGSLVWNTRFVEGGADLSKWTPEDAVVVGMLRHYDPQTNTLLGLRVDRLLPWL